MIIIYSVIICTLFDAEFIKEGWIFPPDLLSGYVLMLLNLVV
jgi:hypothetical protein